MTRTHTKGTDGISPWRRSRRVLAMAQMKPGGRENDANDNRAEDSGHCACAGSTGAPREPGIRRSATSGT